MKSLRNVLSWLIETTLICLLFSGFISHNDNKLNSSILNNNFNADNSLWDAFDWRLLNYRPVETKVLMTFWLLHWNIYPAFAVTVLTWNRSSLLLCCLTELQPVRTYNKKSCIHSESMLQLAIRGGSLTLALKSAMWCFDSETALLKTESVTDFISDN